jgi:ABC-type antimicrobial peptide transport system permease subunit
VPLALATGRALKTLLFSSSGADAGWMTLAIVLLVAIGVAAGVMPAQRATRIEPAEALRCD